MLLWKLQSKFWGRSILSVAIVFLAWTARSHAEFFGVSQRANSRLTAAQKIKKLNLPALPASVLNASRTNNKKKIDKQLSRQWGLTNIGFFKLFTSLNEPQLTIIKKCSPSVVVAVIDTGIDYTHPDIKENLWVNKGEVGKWTPSKTWKPKPGGDRNCRDKSCNGIDDDGNGFADDVVGWDFVHNIPLPFDTHGHGTHIAGIIAGRAGNGIGVSGVCPSVSIMALKYYDNSVMGYSNLQNTVRAIKYASENGAHIINYSGGGSDPAAPELKAVETAQRRNILFVAAAGNNGQNNDWVPYYPATYSMDNIISVASTDRNNQLLPSSNFGGKAVDVAAPGLDILSTLPGNRYGMMSGTSQATAFVTGLAALLASQYTNIERQFSYKEIKRLIVKNTLKIKSKKSKKLMKGGLVSVPKAMAAQNKSTRKTVPAVARGNRK